MTRTTVSRSQVLAYMLECWLEHLDETCGVLNTTSLAEDAADHFNMQAAPAYEIPEFVYECALDVERSLLKQGRINS